MSKDTSFKFASICLSSDQWLTLSVAEEFTYDEYCISAKNNKMTIATKEQWFAEVLSQDELNKFMREDQGNN